MSVRSPSIVPQGFDVDVYLALDDFGKLGRSYRDPVPQRAGFFISSASVAWPRLRAGALCYHTQDGSMAEDVARELRKGGVHPAYIRQSVKTKTYATENAASAAKPPLSICFNLPK